LTKKPHRTRPLDRDGDGHDGGSLPGNETAPMATPDPTEARDNDRIVAKLQAAQVAPDTALTDASLADEVAALSDDQAREVEAFADAMNAAGRYQDEAGDERNADGSAIALPEALSRFTIGEAGEANPGDATDTFDAEQVQAAHEVAAANLAEGDLIDEEGETTRPPEAAAQPIDEDDPLIRLETETAPVAVRIRELRLLIDNRRLYKSAHGYSATYGPPYVDQATVDVWIKAGLAEDVPTAGNQGGVRVLAEARRALTAHLSAEVA
jgi:hypothetical protein